MGERQSFLERVSPTLGGRQFLLPQPKLDPLSRLQRRQAWRNERVLFRRRCSLCCKQIVSVYSENTPFPVFCPECWWSDRWDPFAFGRKLDFTRNFFSQLQDLQQAVPRISLIHLGYMENSDYTNDVIRLKDCFLIFDGEQSRNCAYGETFYQINDCYDFLDIHNCELCYECVACEQCYQLKFSHNCFQCSDSWFLKDCRGCKNCFGCTNLQQKEYHIFNQPQARDEFEKFIAQFNSENYEVLQDSWDKAKQFWASEPVRYMRGIQNENVSGDYLSHSKNSIHCFNSKQLRDCQYCTNIVLGANDCQDIDVWGNGIELCYDCECIGENVRECLFSLYVSQGAEKVYYSSFCSRQVHDLFGCIGLRKCAYAILNLRYSREDYEHLTAKLIDHMGETTEWGEFFPVEHSPFPYNLTVAQEYFPLTRHEVEAEGWGWQNPPDTSVLGEDQGMLVGEFHDALELALERTFRCEETGRLFRFQRSELEFYKRMHLPLPRVHSDVRHRRRMALRNPRMIFLRQCGQCGVDLQTTYGPTTTAKILCETCYQKWVS